MEDEAARIKRVSLENNIKKMNSLLVSFSGGVDSSLLLAIAHQVLGENVLAVTIASTINPARETEFAEVFAKERGIRHLVLKSDLMDLTDFVSNDEDRCYHCKKHILSTLIGIAKENDIKYVAHGANVDDLKDYRPGFRAATELGVIAPLMDAELNKNEIRILSKEMDLSTWDKPPMPCLATRIPYGTAITEERLKMIDEGEKFLWYKGIRHSRVRHQGSIAKIEIAPSEFEKIIDDKLRLSVVDYFRNLGFKHVALDLEGYITGKMNRSLQNEEEANNGSRDNS